MNEIRVALPAAQRKTLRLHNAQSGIRVVLPGAGLHRAESVHSSKGGSYMSPF